MVMSCPIGCMPEFFGDVTTHTPKADVACHINLNSGADIAHSLHLYKEAYMRNITMSIVDVASGEN